MGDCLLTGKSAIYRTTYRLTQPSIPSG